MEAEAIVGFVITGIALALLVSFGLWSRSSINRISKKKTGSLREIQKHDGR